jgi:hypothetical protein
MTRRPGAGKPARRPKQKGGLPMTSVRRHLWKAAGLVLAATTAGSAAAQAVRPVTASADVLAEIQAPHAALPVVPAPAAPAAAGAAVPAGTACEAVDSGWLGLRLGSLWPRWPARADRQRCNLQGILWGYPEEFRARPLGQAVHDNALAMVNNGVAAHMVLYHYDFIEGSDALNPHGRDQLAKIVSRLGGNAFPIIIERTPGVPGLAEARRQAVINVLGHNAIPVGPERVVIGPPIAVGISGTEADLVIAPGLLLNMRTQSAAISIPPSGTTSNISTGFGGTPGTAGGALGPASGLGAGASPP